MRLALRQKDSSWLDDPTSAVMMMMLPKYPVNGVCNLSANFSQNFCSQSLHTADDSKVNSATRFHESSNWREELLRSRNVIDWYGKHHQWGEELSNILRNKKKDVDDRISNRWVESSALKTYDNEISLPKVSWFHCVKMICVSKIIAWVFLSST